MTREECIDLGGHFVADRGVKGHRKIESEKEKLGK